MGDTCAPTPQAQIHVIGDSTIDWMLTVPSPVHGLSLQTSYQWEQRASVEFVAQPGGAALVRQLIDVSVGVGIVTGASVPLPARANPADNSFSRTYTVWQPYPVTRGAPEIVWRMQTFLGMQVAAAAEPSPVTDIATVAGGVVVIDDANLTFRHQPAKWPAPLFVTGVVPRHIILKLSNPLTTGPLWSRLLTIASDILTVYISVGDLRKEYAPIGQPLSWERIAADTLKAVRSRADLGRAARIVVAFGMSGAMVIERDGCATLIYDPVHQEGDWERAHPGMTVGLGTCITAALAIAAHQSVDAAPDWVEAIRSGLAAGRALHDGRRLSASGTADTGLQFPYETVASLLSTPADETSFRTATVPDDHDWHLLSTITHDGYRAIASRIVQEGDNVACRDVPIERIGAWASIDRTEIESMRSIRSIIREYVDQTRRTRPLSLAVFGPPGSGKSFAIKQMAREWGDGHARIEVLEFNLSQFSAQDDLPVAFQRVRDAAVTGALPLVFWDEFDSLLNGSEMGWLSRFLAPMQDGAFSDGGALRPIGTAIFIFAGGTHATMARFKARAVELPSAKATDFLSRLRGFVDILGPNPTGADDRTAVLRRALLLRTLLASKAPQLVRGGTVDIDPGVLRALLDVTTYVHGARSMESVIDMSTLTGKLRYERSALPPRHQLSLHVDADEFLALVHDGG